MGDLFWGAVCFVIAFVGFTLILINISNNEYPWTFFLLVITAPLNLFIAIDRLMKHHRKSILY